MEPDEKERTDEWWIVFQRASELRERLREVESGYQREAKRTEMAEIKREAFDILCSTDIPSPLKVLIVDLWGGVKGFLQWNPDKTAAAIIEARSDAPLGKKKLSTLLRKELESQTDYTRQIMRW